MSYFISPPSETSWCISEESISTALRARWPDAEIRNVSNPLSVHCIEWHILLDGRLLDGSCDRTGQVIHLDGDIVSSARFAVWFRTVVPHQQTLVFYDEGYTAHVTLTDNTTAEQVAEPFLS